MAGSASITGTDAIGLTAACSLGDGTGAGGVLGGVGSGRSSGVVVVVAGGGLASPSAPSFSSRPSCLWSPGYGNQNKLSSRFNVAPSNLNARQTFSIC